MTPRSLDPDLLATLPPRERRALMDKDSLVGLEVASMPLDMQQRYRELLRLLG